MSDRMEQLIREYRLIPPGSTVLCAVSGGADSVYLLHRLYTLRRELDFTLVAAHYDHRLRGRESTQDAKFVEEFVRLCCPAERLYTPEGPGKELPGVRLITGSGDVAGEAARLRQSFYLCLFVLYLFCFCKVYRRFFRRKGRVPWASRCG